MNAYDRGFYEAERQGSLISAQCIVPHVLRYVRPRSVVDVGCGIGTWLSVFKEQGIREVFGVDGDYVERHLLMVDSAEFLAHDLTQPLAIGRRYDLAVSLEVAEHLPASAASTFVTSLTALAPVVLFSAAIPHQGGRHHVNEQWPAYWARLFAERGFRVVDCLRQEIWSLEHVKPHYPQNLMFFVDERALTDFPELEAQAAGSPRVPPPLVHPGIFDYQLQILRDMAELKPGSVSPFRVLGQLPSLFVFELRRACVSLLERMAPRTLRRLRAVKKRSVHG